MRKGSIKSTRINSEVAKCLSEIIRSELKDPRIHPLTSVLSADVTTDLKQCKAYISVLGDADAKKETMEGLRAAASFIRHELAAQVNLRNTPAVTFVLDERIEQGMHMSRLIEEVKARDDAAIALRGDEETEQEDDDEFDF
ncbi:MAG: 30S ribosome-binding factor RbfA [Lachnospiraceae bacterium]|nr:30S ribosome-binding factor RbfA [Lachnospiraceae bacterium]MBP5253980.1 30S ribosome-binding factor RbfA [Lachnospiraceae bacterium]